MAAIVHESQSKAAKPNELRSQQSNGGTQGLSCESAPGFTPFPKNEVAGSVSQRFEKLVCMHPDRIAVKTARAVVTYAELNAMANRMAHAIVARRGTEAEAIAILLEKGPRLMAAMLAVLKAGKFFVLMDLSYPKARLAAVLKDSEAALFISDRDEYEEIRQVVRAIPSLLEFDAIPADAAEKNLGLTISPNSLAAIVYTSGSTGEPKGVMRAQRNLLHQTMLFAHAYKLSECDRLLLTTSGTANALSISFLGLLTGAALLPFDVKSQGIGMLVRWIVDEKISICWMGSPLFRNMCQALTSKETFSDVRIVRLSSEASFKSDIELYKRHFSPKCQLINGLSNTEAGLICLYPVDRDTEFTGQDFPVGYSVEDKEIVLLDDSGKEVGANTVGEIAIRSRYLSPGYWRRPELTEHKFKADPSSGDQRVYLTGDLGLMLFDRSLIHKGRKDFRVKIRGYGVELAEIEKALNGHATVVQAIVAARKKENGEAKLIAYYCCTDRPAPTVSDFRAFLKTQLPDYMIPSTFVRLDEMPLTESGKIDRRALPDPDNVRPDLASPYFSSRNEIEQRLVAIWEDVLDVCPVGVNDGFFDLGGDSLSATRVISQVLKHFDLEIPLQVLFQSPTIAQMAAVVARAKDKLSEDSKTLRAAAVFSAWRDDFLPLSYSQQRLWFLEQLDPGSSSYNLFSAYQLKGDIDISALEQTFNEIVRRHEVLRTVFKSEDGSPKQVVLPNLTIKIPVVDLRARGSAEERWTEARRMFTEEAQRPFDLAAGPLLRITLLQLADHEHVLLRAMHHIVSDGWSAGVLFREVSEIYAALVDRRPPSLADLPIQYADYAKWQRQRFDGEQLESHLFYWKKQLANIATLQFPTDRPRQTLQAARGARRYFVFSERLSSELKHLSRRHGATPFMILLAAFQTLLHRYSGQTDIAIGSAVAGRSRNEFEALLGLFLNMLVLRLDLSGNPTFVETIARVREVCLEALSHQELPFEKLVEELHPERLLGRNPLFQVSFTYQNTPQVPLRLSRITVEDLEVETGIARFDLHLFMEEVGGHLKGYCDYDINLFDAGTIERMLGHFQTLLEGIVVNPEQPISQLPLLTESEKRQLLCDWKDTKREYPKDKCIHELFETQVEKTPEGIALVFKDQQLTYRELNDSANQLAHHLHKLGVGPDVLVGICMERSIEMVVGLLGVLKAGGAYVPLDPSYPQDRLAFMLEDSRAALLITQSPLIGRLPAHNATVICLDRDWRKISTERKGNPPLLSTPDNLAYVIYTSGSTGMSKGALIPHHNIVRLFSATDSWFNFGPADVWTLFHSYAFDFSVWEIWGALVHGGRLVIVPFEVSRSALEFYELLCREQVTILNQTPSAFRQLVQVEEAIIETGCLGLRLVIFGGEVLGFQSLKAWFDRHGDQRPQLINMYGITETTVHVTHRVIKKADLSVGGFSLIGVPIPDLELYVLDSHRNLVPVGVPGELYVGGPGLARGYLNRDELTVERFVDHSFDAGQGRRLYRSGDLVRRRSDGDIEYLGRIDHQVKIRGYRIEPGEIEALLSQHPCIQHAVVLATEETPGDKRLAAYIVTATGSAIPPRELRSYLQQKLPEYMVPSAFVFLDFLPLTPNGKIDRQALPKPGQQRSVSEENYIAPRTEYERIVTRIWAEVLRLSRVGVSDNFFELGGHSLLATQVVSRLREALGVDLSLRTLFEKPAVANLCDHLETIRPSGKRDHFTIDDMNETEDVIV